MAKLEVRQDNVPQKSKITVTVLDKGPYMVSGQPPLTMQFIMVNQQKESWYFQQGPSFKMAEPTALCRCGASDKKPYCDGAHLHLDWDPSVTAPVTERIMDKAEVVEGETLKLTDAGTKYCAFARFCDPAGDVWTLTEEHSGNPAERDLAIREASMCPAGRLNAWDRKTGKTWEFDFEPSLALVEDPALHASGGLWVRGGITVRRENGEEFEQRNRAVLCRCGRSDNKPYCNGAHAAKPRWDDRLNGKPEGETLPEVP